VPGIQKKISNYRWRILRIIRLMTARWRKGPDYLVIGAQKSGTTSLRNMLSQHPLIKNPIKKEIHYFDNNYHRTISWYRSNFPISQNYLTGEATPSYFYNPFVADRIKKHFPECKFILLLRNPIDRAYSHYQMHCRRGGEALSFEESIEMEEERLYIAKQKLCKNPEAPHKDLYRYSYLDRGLYDDQLARWLKFFDRSQIHIISFDEFVHKPRMTLNGICDFLHLPYLDDVAQINKNRGIYTPMSHETRSKLRAYFAPHNERLFEMIGRRFPWE
jgi:sulfotransferase family protein